MEQLSSGSGCWVYVPHRLQQSSKGQAKLEKITGTAKSSGIEVFTTSAAAALCSEETAAFLKAQEELQGSDRFNASNYLLVVASTASVDKNSVEKIAEKLCTIAVKGHRYANTRVVFRIMNAETACLPAGFSHVGGLRPVSTAELSTQNDAPTNVGSLSELPFGSGALSFVAPQLLEIESEAQPPLITLHSATFDFKPTTSETGHLPFYYPRHTITLDFHCSVHTIPPKRVPLQPVETPRYGLDRTPCTSTDLVIFLLCPRLNPTTKQLEILMLLEKSNKWFVPAGHVEPGQSFLEASKQELLEETGLTLDLKVEPLCYDLVYGSCSYDGYPPSVAPIHALYVAKIDDSVPAIDAVDGHGNQWVLLEEAMAGITKHNSESSSVVKAPVESGALKGHSFRKPWELAEVVGRFQQFVAKHPSHLEVFL